MKKLNKSNKNSVRTPFSRLDQTKQRISGLGDKIDVLEHADDVKEKKLKNYKQNIQDLCQMSMILSSHQSLKERHYPSKYSSSFFVIGRSHMPRT
jgi:hypothetical protein